MSERPTNPNLPKPEIPKQEVELSPEVIEMVMEKVEDIYTPGTAFHVLNALQKWHGEKGNVTDIETIDDVLRDGVLGKIPERGEEPLSRHRGAFVEDIKSGKMPRVWFDIVGRSARYNLPHDSIWMQGGVVSVAIIFDLSKFSDGIGQEEDYRQKLEELKKRGSTDPEADYRKEHEKIGTFFSSSAYRPLDHNLFNTKGFTMSNEGSGFTLFGRVSPRHFRGIILRLRKQGQKELKVEDDQTRIQGEVDKIVSKQLKTYKNKPEMLLPIYDSRGHLLWPKQVDYKELYKEEEK
ncbi:MAG: hypothetical protein ABIH87_01115 [bacterium]